MHDAWSVATWRLLLSGLLLTALMVGMVNDLKVAAAVMQKCRDKSNTPC
jgi:hypothetical protein